MDCAILGTTEDERVFLSVHNQKGNAFLVYAACFHKYRWGRMRDKSSTYRASINGLKLYGGPELDELYPEVDGL